MSAMYQANFSGQGGSGSAALFVGRNVISGIDETGAVYDGSYIDAGDRIFGTVTMTVTQGTALVTGQVATQDGQIQMDINWPKDFSIGRAQEVFVAGQPVAVVFRKLRDVP